MDNSNANIEDMQKLMQIIEDVTTVVAAGKVAYQDIADALTPIIEAAKNQ